MIIIGCLIVAYLAYKRGRRPVVWFFISCLITPIISGIILFYKDDLSCSASTIDYSYKKKSDSGAKELSSSDVVGEEDESVEERRKQYITVDIPQVKICPHCNQQIRKGARMCRFCRMELGDDGHLICPHCNASIPKIYIFNCKCPACDGFIDYNWFVDEFDDDDDDLPRSGRRKKSANGGGAAAAAVSSCGGSC